MCFLTGIGLLALCAWIWWPGLYGNFYLDDFPNLSPLETAGKNGTPFLSYLVNPAVSGLGRPLSYLTFLLQQDSWPDDAFYFKLVNLGVHLANSALVFFIALLAIRLGTKPQLPRAHIYTLALGCSVIWTILPIHASAIFYVVQRMTLLSAFFTLSGILGYLWVRSKYPSWGTKQYIVAAFFVCFGYMGILAKENAIQTGLLLWALELTILARLSWRPSVLFQSAFFLAPILLLFIYLFTINDVLSGYEHRDFTLKERLLTQAVIFWEYLSKIFIPTPSRLHLFNDGGPTYSQVVGEIIVLVSLIGIVSSLTFAVLMRRKYPWLSFAILFFCFSHILESTFIPLEMNFEHRNYLPSVGLLLGFLVSLFLIWSSSRLQAYSPRIGVSLVLVWGIYLSGVSMLEARTWGSSKSFALSSLVDRPDSYRARQEAAAFFMAHEEYLTTANILYSIDTDFKVYAGTYAQLLLLKCYEKDLPLPTHEEIERIFEAAPTDLGVEMALHDIWKVKRSNVDNCRHITWEQFLTYINALIRNEHFSGSLNLKLLASFIHADNQRHQEAIKLLEDLPPSQKNIAVRILIARFYIMAQQPMEALKIISDILDGEDSIEKLVYANYLESLRDRILTERDL